MDRLKKEKKERWPGLGAKLPLSHTLPPALSPSLSLPPLSPSILLSSPSPLPLFPLPVSVLIWTPAVDGSDQFHSSAMEHHSLQQPPEQPEAPGRTVRRALPPGLPACLPACGEPACSLSLDRPPLCSFSSLSLSLSSRLAPSLSLQVTATAVGFLQCAWCFRSLLSGGLVSPCLTVNLLKGIHK